MNESKSAKFRTASRVIGYGGVIVALIAAAVWYIVSIVIQKQEFERLELFGVKTLPLVLLICAGAALVCIIIAIILRIIAAVKRKHEEEEAEEEDTLSYRVTSTVRTKTGAAKEKVLAAKDKVVCGVKNVGSRAAENKEIVIPVLSAIGGLIAGVAICVGVSKARKRKAAKKLLDSSL